MKKKGFTLIELLAVIVILAIIMVIAVPKILDVIESSKRSAAKSSTELYVEAIEYKTALAILNSQGYEDKDDYMYNEIEVDIKGEMPTSGNYSLKNGKVVSGRFCMHGYEVTFENRSATVLQVCPSDGIKKSGYIKLSSTNGNYIYPTTGTFEVEKNISGGDLSCTSSNEKVATCSISGTTVTVIPSEPQTESGYATLTITSAETEQYNKATASYVVTTAAKLSVTANGYEGSYDGQEHGITVACSDATITYGMIEGTYDLPENPKFIDAGNYTVYYKIEKEGYVTATGSETVIINKIDGSVTPPVAKTLTYNGSAQELITAGSSKTGTIQYSLNSGAYSTNIPTAINAGTYTVSYKVIGDKNHKDVDAKSITVVIQEPAVLETPSSCFSFTNGTITGYTVSDICTTDVIIPKTINGVKVTGIGSGAFYNKGLTSVIISDGVTIIGGSSFQNNLLESVVIPNSVTKINGSAFANNNIKSLEIPSSVTDIMINAFSQNKISNLILHEGLKNIDQDAFRNNNLTTVTIPSTVTVLYIDCFAENPNLTTIYNKTGKTFNFGAVVGGSSSFIETGTVTNDSGKNVVITK